MKEGVKLSAMLIALCALVVSVKKGRGMFKKQTKEAKNNGRECKRERMRDQKKGRKQVAEHLIERKRRVGERKTIRKKETTQKLTATWK